MHKGIPFTTNIFLQTLTLATVISLAAACTIGAAAHGAAAPQTPQTPGTKPVSKMAADWQEWSDLRNKLRQVEEKDPKAAIAQYQTFWEQRPQLDPTVSAQLCTTVAQIYHTGVKDDATALKTCDWAIAQHRTSRERIRPTLYKAQLLAELKRTDEAQAFIEKSWSLMLISGPVFVRPMVTTYVSVMDQQLKSSAAMDQIKATFRRLPVYLGDENWSAGVAMYPVMIQHMTDKRQFDQATRWAKLRFMLCPYTVSSVSRAAGAIVSVAEASTAPLQSTGAAQATQVAQAAQATRAKSAATAKAGSENQGPRVFGQLTPDPDASEGAATAGDANELQSVTLPAAFTAQLATLRTTPLPEEAYDRALVKERLATLGRANEQQRTERITLLLLSGSYRSAMDEAVLYKKELPNSLNGPRQIARVFKAVDVDVKRANAYMEFVKTGKGTNPVVAFLQQFPAEGP